MTAARHPKRARARPAAHSPHLRSYTRPSHLKLSQDTAYRGARDCACCGVSDTIITEDTSRIGFAPPKETGSYAGLAREERRQVCERLITAFQSKPKSDWRRLIAFSKKWPQLADGVFERIQELVDEQEDPEVELKLRRFQKGMRAAHEEVTVYRELYDKFDDVDESEHAALVAGHFEEMTPNFFEYCKDKMNAALADRDIPEEKREGRRMEITTRVASIMALYEAYQAATQDQERNNLASANFKHLLQVGNMAEAQQEIDKMAAQGTLDPAFLTTMAKAYSGVKESPYTKDDTKEVMHKLYMQARETSNRQQPAEVRILKHLLTIEDPKHRRSEMESAFEIGPELETANEDYLWTTPEKLLLTIDSVLSCFQNFKGDTSALGSAMSVLMKPTTIEKMEVIKQEIEKDFM